jgi:molybdopterin molybdotransferase
MTSQTSHHKLAHICQSIPNYDANSMSVEQAQYILRFFVSPITEIESCIIHSALNRVLAEDIISPIDVPAHDNSAMDGFAFRGEQLCSGQTLQLKIVGTALAGHAYNLSNDELNDEVKFGECISIMTGAVMPLHCNTVIPQEHIQLLESGHILIEENIIKAQQNRRLKGEDLSLGKIVLSKGKVITSSDLGLLASIGIAEIKVYRKLKVALFSTGDELQSLGEQLKEGCVYDSNRYTLFGMLSRLHCDIIDMGIIPDNPVSLNQAMADGCKNADVIITSGGVSKGTADFTKQVMSELGDIAFWNLNIRPGRPFAFGEITYEGQSAYIFGLPGNPVAVMVTFYFLLKNALLQLTGAHPQALLFSSAISKAFIKKRQGRTEYQRGIAQMNTLGQLEVDVTGSQGSGILRSMSEANCMIVLHEDQTNIALGDIIHIVLFDGLI